MPTLEELDPLEKMVRPPGCLRVNWELRVRNVFSALKMGVVDQIPPDMKSLFHQEGRPKYWFRGQIIRLGQVVTRNYGQEKDFNRN